MDYQIHVYPSSAAEMQNIRAESGTKQIKVLGEGKIQALYKKSFGAAVTRYNERVTSGKLIDNYYKSILKSNIPEVYRMSLLIRYDTTDKSEASIANKALIEFKKALEKENNLVVVSAYIMSFNEYKDLQVFFYPVASDYATGLSVRNDLIDVTKKIHAIKENLNLAQAMPLFVKHLDSLFDPINNSRFMSQAQLEELIKRANAEDPMDLHAIAIDTLKEQMRSLQKLNAENKQLEAMIENEKQRIANDIVWFKDAEKKIYEAEAARIAELKRIEEEERKKEADRKALEAQKREEERLRDEARRVEAERLADQARRNLALKEQFEREERERKEEQMKQQIQQLLQEEMDAMVAKHIEWQNHYALHSIESIEDIAEEAMADERRINLIGAELHDIALNSDIKLIAVSFEGCKFSGCKIAAEIVCSSISKCEFANSDLNGLVLRNSQIADINLDEMEIGNVQIYGSSLSYVSVKDAVLADLISAQTTKYVKCDFTNTVFNGCDMKHSVFTRCDFVNTKFNACDMRKSIFRVSDIDTMDRGDSSFRGVKIEKK